MHHIITFTSPKFDMSKEKENPINPIYGQSLLLWLKEKLKGTLTMPEPGTEDWGWYTDIEWEGKTYLLGSVALEADDGDHEWIFQVHKNRTFFEALLGKEKMTKNDSCLLYFKNIFEAEPSFNNVKIK